jgi:hypothetical protein
MTFNTDIAAANADHMPFDMLDQPRGPYRITPEEFEVTRVSAIQLERRQARLVSSAIQARAGGGGLDPGVVDLEEDVAGEGEYRALSAIFAGDSGALGANNAAEAALRTGSARAKAYDYQTASTVLQSGSSMYSRYGQQG